MSRSLKGSFSVVGPPSSSTNLQTLVRLRTLAITGQTLTLVVASSVLGVPLPVIALGIGIMAYAAVNLVVWDSLRRNVVPDDAAFFRQILIDIAVLTYLLCLAGGPTNPFHDMYLLPLTMAAVSLPWHYVWRTAVIGIACYTLVMAVHLPLAVDPQTIVHLLRFGEWVNHSILAILIAYFAVRMSAGLRERDRLLAEAHEREVRAGCAVTLGSVAAGIAHELGSPLSSMSLVLDEMRDEHGHQPELRRSIDLLYGGLAACRQSLGNLRKSCIELREEHAAIPVDQFIERIAKRFRATRPGVDLKLTLDGPLPAPQIVPDLAFQQAVVNLLSNAAFVSLLDVRLTASWDARELKIQVADKGPGISQELAGQLGRILVTTKPADAGTGLGLFLTNVTMNRLGGRLRLFNQLSGGAVAELAVPIESLAGA